MSNVKRYKLEGKPGAWMIQAVDTGSIIQRVSNRGHAMAILHGLENPKKRKSRYSFRKVYRFLQANGWRIELHDVPDVYWRSPDGTSYKENRQLGPQALLLAMVGKEGKKAYLTAQRNALRS